MHRRALGRFAVAAPVVALAASALGACGGHERSATAVCHVFRTDGVALHDKMERTADSGDLFSNLGQLAGAPGEFATLFNKLDAVSPADIEPSMHALASAFEDISSKEGADAINPLAGVADALAAGANTQQPMNAVNAYLRRNCSLDGLT